MTLQRSRWVFCFGSGPARAASRAPGARGGAAGARSPFGPTPDRLAVGRGGRCLLGDRALPRSHLPARGLLAFDGAAARVPLCRSWPRGAASRRVSRLIRTWRPVAVPPVARRRARARGGCSPAGRPAVDWVERTGRCGSGVNIALTCMNVVKAQVSSTAVRGRWGWCAPAGWRNAPPNGPRWGFRADSAASPLGLVKGTVPVLHAPWWSARTAGPKAGVGRTLGRAAGRVGCRPAQARQAAPVKPA